MANDRLNLRAKKGVWQSLHQLTIVLLSAIALILVATAFLNSLAYIRSFVDDTAYHVPMAVEIARHGNPFYVDTDSAFTSFWFPAGGETIVAMLVSLAPTIDSTNLTGALFFVLFLVITYKFAEIWTDDRRVRLLCVVTTSLIPILLAQTTALYVDIHFGFFVYLSLYLLCSSLVTKDAKYSYLGIAAAILSASVKYHGLVVCAVMVPAGAYLAFRSEKRALGWWILLVLVISTAFTSGWYVRNWLHKGNPIYPLPLPQPLQTLSGVIGTPYQGMDYPSLSPRANWPHPLVPESVSHYNYKPDMTNDAYGLVFPVSIVMLIIAGAQTKKMSKEERHAYVLLLVLTTLIVAGMPSWATIPRYVLFLPAVAALWPSMILACASQKNLAYGLVAAIIIVIGVTYIQANLLDGGPGRSSVLQKAIAFLQEDRRSDIVHFDFVEQGNLRIGYLGGRFEFIAALYDSKLTNNLIQLHYQDYRLNKGKEFEDPKVFVRHVQSLNLDYICIFDERAPGANLLLTNFPERTFVEGRFK